MQALDRMKGCLLGLAVCDALGASVEFLEPGEFEPLTGMRGGGTHNLKPGYWTDDTSMALCLAESLIKCNGFNEKDVMDRWVRWMREGYMSSTGECFDVGNTTRMALENYIRTSDIFSGVDGAGMQGNAPIMRLAPIVMFYHENQEKAMNVAVKSCVLTHSSVECMEATEYFACLIMRGLKGKSKEEIFTSGLFEFCNTSFSSRVRAIDKGSYREKDEQQISNSGYIISTLETAMWVFYHTHSFREGALKAVNLGGDSDTIGAVYGQLAGAYYGLEEIPEEWLNILYKREMIEDIAEEIYSDRYAGS